MPQKTRAELQVLIDEIRIESSAGGNTRGRVADVLQNIVDSGYSRTEQEVNYPSAEEIMVRRGLTETL
jgi:hypothetical protein